MKKDKFKNYEELSNTEEEFKKLSLENKIIDEKSIELNQLIQNVKKDIKSLKENITFFFYGILVSLFTNLLAAMYIPDLFKISEEYKYGGYIIKLILILLLIFSLILPSRKILKERKYDIDKLEEFSKKLKKSDYLLEKVKILEKNRTNERQS